MGLYDVPANYKLILSFYTPSTKITFIAHSQGTSQFLVAGTDLETKEFATFHTAKFIALAPIAYMTYIHSSATSYFAKFQKLIKYAANELQIYDIVNGGCENNSSWAKL